MSSKFRQDALKRNYTVRTFLRRILGTGLVTLLLIACIATLIAFYILIEYQVQQSIEIGYMKNLNLRTKTLTSLKMNDFEMTGNDLSVSAHILSELVSRRDEIEDEDYNSDYAKYIEDGYRLSQCQSTYCPTINGISFKFDYKGHI